nr:zinc-ribbon domain-containing protein [uncultured Aminipila sp.]
MFCRKCGKTLLDGDRFCSYCGAQVIERSENIDIGESVEEVIYNDESTIEIPVESMETIGAPQKTIAQTWHEINGKSLDKPPKPHWNLEGFPVAGEETKKTEDIKVDWDKRELLRFETMHEEKQENKPDIFEIFDRQLKEEKETENKNKDTLIFQREPMEKVQQIEPEVKQNVIETTLEQELFRPKDSINDKLHTPVEEQIDKFYTFSKKNEEFQKLLDKEYERLKKTPDFVYPEPKIPSNIEKLELNVPAEQNLEPVIEKTAEKIKEKIENTVEKIEEKPVTKTDENILEQKEKQVEEKEEQIEEQDENSLEKKPDEGEEVSSILPWDEMESPLGEFTDEDAGKKISPMGVILSIIIVLLAFEVAILGIKCFLPESNAAAFINDKLGVAVNWVDLLKNSNKDQEEQKKAEKEAEKSKTEETKEVNAVVKPDPVPNPDKAEEIVYNTNIKSITADDSLAYKENIDYGDKNINNSKPIENNIWYQDENGNTVYYDKEIVKTIIQFDSAWINYVNKKDDTVLGFTKEGSQAYTKTKNFSNVGKITENFDTLKIGEIRQGSNGFYIWVYEAITINQNGKVKQVNYSYIYYLEPVAKQMKIVSYKKL